MKYSPKFLTLKGDAHSLFEKFRKQNQVWKSLEQCSKATETTDARLPNDYVNTKQNNFHINPVFTSLPIFLFYQTVKFYWLLLASIEGTVWSILKKGRGQIPFDCYPRGSSVKRELIIQIL